MAGAEVEGLKLPKSLSLTLMQYLCCLRWNFFFFFCVSCNSFIDNSNLFRAYNSQPQLRYSHVFPHYVHERWYIIRCRFYLLFGKTIEKLVKRIRNIISHDGTITLSFQVPRKTNRSVLPTEIVFPEKINLYTS